MLLIYCPNCQDVLKPVSDSERVCVCGQVRVRENDVEGLHAEVGLTTRGQFSFDAAVETTMIDRSPGKFYGFVSLVQPDVVDTNSEQDS